MKEALLISEHPGRGDREGRHQDAIGTAGRHTPIARKEIPERAGRPGKGSRQVKGGNPREGRTSSRDANHRLEQGRADVARKGTLGSVGNDLCGGLADDPSDRPVHSDRWVRR
ncbi:hypothetical protein MGN01_17010 [Methylobacterium gnaphalii]|uniref:Uncharacterized protein n=1 Tax=Methylobacterium gnaphalii TaxID=1010610 RepID=A0A512JIS8_9HYPH|nr:hypothetical protein MGN01_17010 [Methylobacterium gnaphalii]GLS49885.1 hypothetical protein GCM10007885_27370 [Methylobacterium gnaphalii]